MLTKNDIKRVISLKNRKERDALGLFIAEGVKVVEELILANVDIVEIYALREWFDIIGDNINRLGKATKLVEISQSELNRISNLTTPNLVLALCEIKKPTSTIEINPDELTLVLDGINDPGNMGTIIRTARWFGVNKIICSENTVDIYNPKVVQSTMGAVVGVEVHYANLVELFTNLHNVRIYGTLLDGDDIYNKELSTGVIIIGSESHGISPDVRKFVTDKLLIPDFGKGICTPESLNAGVATAVTLSEFKRRML